MSADSERFPPPNNPDDFESLCLDLWKDIWSDQGADKNGRSGQPQAGVDIYGRQDGQLMGVQCKQKDGLLRRTVTVKELEREVQAAQKFEPKLTSFILATTGAADVKVQKRARELTAEHRDQDLFTVDVWSWEKIWHEIYGREELLRRIGPLYWPRTWQLIENALKRDYSVAVHRTSDACEETVGRSVSGTKWHLCYVVGSSLRLIEGIAGTQHKRNGHHKSLFALETTVILGDSNKRPPYNTCKHTTATWDIPLGTMADVSYKRCFLLIGNLRHFGGLHSPAKDDYVEIYLNDQPVDGFEIKVVPEGQTDYFHKRPFPHIPTPTPFDTCENLYAWPVPTSHLRAQDSAQILVRIDTRTKWDIDYAGLIFELA